MSAKRVAVIGLGRMGGPIADHIIDAGHDVSVFDVSSDAMTPRVERGARRASTPADATRGAELVHVIVFDDEQVLRVLIGHDGAFETLASDAVVSVHTTVSIDTIDQLAAAAAARGISVLDAGISGGEKGAQDGTLVTMVGGEAGAVERARSVIETFSKELVHAGPRGSGMALKLARNAACYATMAALQDAIELAYAQGLDLAQLQHVLNETDVFGMALAPFWLGPPGKLAPDAPHAFRETMEHTLKLADKDLDQSLALAERVGVDVPLFESARRSFRRVVRL